MIQTSTFLFISGTEIAFILFIAIMVFGADKLPEIARGLGKGMRTLKDGIDTSVTKDVKQEIDKVKEDLEDFTGSVKRKL